MIWLTDEQWERIRKYFPDPVSRVPHAAVPKRVGRKSNFPGSSIRGSSPEPAEPTGRAPAARSLEDTQAGLPWTILRRGVAREGGRRSTWVTSDTIVVTRDCSPATSLPRLSRSSSTAIRWEFVNGARSRWRLAVSGEPPMIEWGRTGYGASQRRPPVSFRLGCSWATPGLAKGNAGHAELNQISMLVSASASPRRRATAARTAAFK